MKNTTFVSAGAGSGKTHTLRQEIAKMIETGIETGSGLPPRKIKAEEIILTTYTENAAKDLREKVRSTLYSKGLYEAAMNIDNAAIGTIHSIAFQFVSRYWYLLGISANVSILDDESKKFRINQSLLSLPTEADLLLFDSVFKSLAPTKNQNNRDVPNPDFWKDELTQIIEKTAELCLTDEQLEEARVESKKLINDIMGFCNHFDVSDNIIFELKELADKILDKDSPLPTTNRKKIEPKMPPLRVYRGGADEAKPLSAIRDVANEIAAIKNTHIKANYAAGLIFAADIAERVPHSVQVKNMAEMYIDSVFNLAKTWRKKYDEFKRERCLLDYSDILQKFDELLNKPEVVADIQSRYKVALVDEFQDCSPLQVKSFERLSELMVKSVWVGDIKQAIYGFRGTNTELIQSIIDEANEKNDDGNKRKTLGECWRSNKAIVNLVNNIFCNKVFNGQLDEELIRLGMPNRTENDHPAPKECEVRHINLSANNAVNRSEIVAKIVNEQINKGYPAKGIAVLYRDKYGVKDCAKALKQKGIAFNARWDSNKDDIDADDLISSFITALVSFAARSGNSLSKAIIANRIEEGCTITELITSRLQSLESKNENNSDKWLEDMDVVRRLTDIRNVIGNQSVRGAVETIITELNVADLIKRIEPAAPAYNYCSTLIKTAETYESICSSLGLSSSLIGFVEYLKQHPVDYPGDDNGVNVMTYHKSKGLQWPCVILCSLDSEIVKPEKSFYGVLTHSTKDKTELRLVSSVLKKISKKLLDGFADNEFYQRYISALTNEAKRLMYVGMTRPQEQLILATSGSGNGDKWLTSIGCDSIDSHSSAEVINWGGSILKHDVYEYDTMTLSTRASDVIEFDALKQPDVRPAFDSKFVSPSKAKDVGQRYVVEHYANFAERTSAVGKDNIVGDFFHHVMCLWNGDKDIVEKLAKAYGVKVDVEAVVLSVSNFWSWMEQTYGKATEMMRELPISFTNEYGQVVTGEIDLVYRTAEGDVLVDYKTYQGSPAHLTDENNDFNAGKKYGPQISLYEEALKRNGSVIRDRLICYLSLGVIIRMK